MLVQVNLELLCELGYSGSIISFEPVSSNHVILSKIAKNDVNWHIHPKIAIGSQSGSATINISRNSVSSSLLPMLPLHSDVEPNSSYIDSEIVSTSPLDTLFSQYYTNSSHYMLKIDTQGFEMEVLKEACKYLPTFLLFFWRDLLSLFTMDSPFGMICILFF